MTNIRNNFIDSIGNTPLIKLKVASEITGCNIYGKAEFLNPGGSVKDRAALALIKKVLEVVPLAIHTTDLEIASAAYERQINQIVEGDEETSNYVDALEDSFDAGDYDQMDSNDFVEEVEKFLREQE